MGKKIRQCQRIVADLGIDPDTTGNEQPVEPGPQDQADGNPAFGNTGSEDGPW